MNAQQVAGLQANRFLGSSNPESISVGGSNPSEVEVIRKVRKNHQAVAGVIAIGDQADRAFYTISPQGSYVVDTVLALSSPCDFDILASHSASAWTDISALTNKTKVLVKTLPPVSPMEWLPTRDLAADRGPHRISDEIVSLAPGWDGEGTVAPTSEAKRSTVAVIAAISTYLESAEVEVDPSDGGVTFRWFSSDERFLVSIDIRPTGRAIVTGSNVDGNGSRSSLAPNELDRVLRAAIDAGLTNLVRLP